VYLAVGFLACMAITTVLVVIYLPELKKRNN